MDGDYPIFRGWQLLLNAKRALKRQITGLSISAEARKVMALCDDISAKLTDQSLDGYTNWRRLANSMATDVLEAYALDGTDVRELATYDPVRDCILEFLVYEELFEIPAGLKAGNTPQRSEIWEVEDKLRKTEKVLDDLDAVISDLSDLIAYVITPLIKQHPSIVRPISMSEKELAFSTPVVDNLDNLPEIVEAMVLAPFAPEFEEIGTTANLKNRLEYNLIIASGGIPSDPETHPKNTRLPTKAPQMPTDKLIRTYLEGTPLRRLFEIEVSITLPAETRFEHHHIVAGSGHGKTQTLQHLILHDLNVVAAGEASIVVIDSQSDLIRNIAGLQDFAPGGPLADQLCVIDPTDVEWPVALNLFDVGMERINQYSQLDREKLINGILELYDFVLGSLLDASMTQKQSVIFRYITRLLLHIPGATIHTFRELLEDGGHVKYSKYIAILSGSARSFFENEYESKEFTQTRKQVLRRLYGILENQSFERMFSHPKSKLDLFSEMNAGKVILINTAKDLLKENGTEIFGRFFIAMIAQAAQERAVFPVEKRLPTYVYVDEANDYFDRNIGIILSQARKYKVGMVLAHQFLGQLDTKLHEAISANTSIKFAGGVSAKDARALSGDLRTDPAFIEGQEKLSFAAYVKGSTNRAVSISVTPGQMERLPRLNDDELEKQRDGMRSKYAVHYLEAAQSDPDKNVQPDDEPDTGEPMSWT